MALSPCVKSSALHSMARSTIASASHVSDCRFFSRRTCSFWNASSMNAETAGATSNDVRKFSTPLVKSSSLNRPG